MARPAGPAAPAGRTVSDPLAGLPPRTAAILCYVPTLGWVASVIVLASQRFRREDMTRFHAFQGLYLFAVWLLVQWVVRPVLIASSSTAIRFDRGLEAVVVLASVFMLVKTAQGADYVLPVIGELAQRSAAEQ